MVAMNAANDGRPSGVDSAASSICPKNTPSSAPSSVTSIATFERNRTQSRMIAMPMPMSSPTGTSCSEPKSIITPRAETSMPFLSPSRAPRSAAPFSASTSVSSIVVADVGGGELAVR